MLEQVFNEKKCISEYKLVGRNLEAVLNFEASPEMQSHNAAI